MCKPKIQCRSNKNHLISKFKPFKNLTKFGFRLEPFVFFSQVGKKAFSLFKAYISSPLVGIVEKFVVRLVFRNVVGLNQNRCGINAPHPQATQVRRFRVNIFRFLFKAHKNRKFNNAKTQLHRQQIPSEQFSRGYKS